MLPESDFIRITIELRKAILAATGLDENRVKNVTSVRGPLLLKIINETDLNSYNLNDSFIIFELKESQDKPYFILEENDEENCMVYSMQMDLKMYGKPCHILSRKLLSAFQEDSMLIEIYDKGMYFKGITTPTTANEFINETLWPRVDMTMNLELREIVPKYKKIEYFDEKDVDYIGSKIKIQKQ